MDEMRTERRRAGGFSLVELLVAMAITAIVSVAVLALMDSTSDSMNMAESSAEALDRTRFALDRVKSQLRNAGSYASVDSRDDPRFKPPQTYIDKRNAAGESLNGVLYEGTWKNNGCAAMTSSTPANESRRLAGLVSYSGWQDYASSVMTSNHQTAHTQGGNLMTQFDGIVVMGAYDYPVPFDITMDPSNSDPDKWVVPDNPSGTYRLANPDPFHTDPAPPSNFPSSDLEETTNGKSKRLLRIMDHHGNFQFSAIKTSKFDTPNNNELQLELPDSHRPFFKPKSEPYGLEPCSQQSGDVSYRGALVDAYWLHVRQDPNNDQNYQLVRQRLDTKKVVKNLTGDGTSKASWSSFSPSSHTIGSPAVIADQVVDFQIWFDCATGSDGTVSGAYWPTGWRIVDSSGNAIGNTSSSATNCLKPSDPQPARARMAHVRLALRTANERGNLSHSMFQGGANETLQTFDLHTGHDGAAGVVTAQLDFELPNYAAQNITDVASTSSSSP